MEGEMLTAIAPALIAAIGYISLITWLYLGWRRLRPCDTDRSIPQTRISIIIPARNEEKNIQQCLEGIYNQDYDKSLFEVIVVDDHSGDYTSQLVKEISGKYSELAISLLNLTSTEGKKAAIQLAMQSTSGTLILSTDADCQHPPGWISRMVRCFEQEDPVFLSGPVLLRSEGGLLGTFQELEFMSLVASGAGAIGAGTPIMCNGANLGFSAAAWRQLQGDAMKSLTASGDDVFMMLAMKEKFGAGRIAFVKDAMAVCQAKAAETLSNFMHQRLRWVSKSRFYRDPFLITSSMIVLMMNLGIIAYAFAGLWNAGFTYISLSLLLVKTFAEFPLLLSFSRFAGKKSLLWFIPLVAPLVVVYTTLTAIAGNLVNVGWKGRKVR